MSLLGFTQSGAQIAGRMSNDGAVHISEQPPAGLPVTHLQVSAGTVSAEHLAANAARRFLLIQNQHASAVIYAAFGVAAQTTNGVKIKPGEALLLGSGLCPTAGVNLISDTASTAVHIVHA